MAARWPLHPRPLPGEALSSWLTRIADAYELSLHDLLLHDLGFDSVSDQQLDTEAPDELVSAISRRTGVEISRIRRMTLSGIVLDIDQATATGPDQYEVYVRQHSVLLPRGCSRKKRVDSDWRPWFSGDRYNTPWACPQCWDVRPRHFHKLLWRFPLTISCPLHKEFLRPVNRIGIVDLNPSKPKSRQVPPFVLWLDAVTEQAVTDARVELPTVCLSAGSWIQVLRTVLDELNTTVNDAGGERGPLIEAWKAIGCQIRAGTSPVEPFEYLTTVNQSTYLEAAAFLIHGLLHRGFRTSGEHAVLLGGEMSSPTRLSGSHSSKVGDDDEVEPPPHRGTDANRQLAEALAEFDKWVRETPEGARELRRNLLHGKTTAEDIAKVDQMLIADGIAIVT